MAAGAATLDRRIAHRSGTTWHGFHVLVEDSSDGETWVPRDLTGADIACQFRDVSGTVVIDMTLDDGITVPDPTTGEILVTGPGIVTASPGLLTFDLLVTLDSGAVIVELDGSQEVIAGVTEIATP
jgi:hypothetical protein